ncbi:hypothetical protein CG709_03440, partial [Lachnotalea glycerini]
MKITNVSINGIANPVGFIYDKPLCSWNVIDTVSKKQDLATIEVSDSREFRNILYKKEDKALKQSGETLHMDLEPRKTYYYRVTVTGEAGDKAVSDIQTFETGKMGESWEAEWISSAKSDSFHPIFIKKFGIQKKVKRARLYVTGMGLVEAYGNKKKLGEEVLAAYI